LDDVSFHLVRQCDTDFMVPVGLFCCFPSPVHTPLSLVFVVSRMSRASAAIRLSVLAWISHRCV